MQLRTALHVFVLVVLCVAGDSRVAVGQARPTPAQAQQLLETRPDLVRALQARLMASGLTPAQVRERLKAEGYPESMLDAYLSGGTMADSLGMPGDDVFAAVRLLGVVDSSSLDSMRVSARKVRRDKAVADSAFLDTLVKASLNDSTRDVIRRLLRSRDLIGTQADSGFNVFGLEVFQADRSDFNGNEVGPVDATYRVGPGDRLVIILTGDTEASYDRTITREGFIALPSVGVLPVNNLTLSELDDLLYTRLGRVYSGIRRGAGATTHFQVSVARLRSNQVFVLGDVTDPGSKRISSAGTVLTALYSAGGPTLKGSMRTVQVRRGDNLVATLDVYDYILRGRSSSDWRLQSGDVVFVPPRGPQVRIAGAVQRPATYEIKAGETLADLIQIAGGFAATADRRRVSIDRVIPPAQRVSAGADRKMVEVASATLETSFGPPEPLEPGDIVRVFEISKRQSNRVTVNGSVWNPGPVGFTQGMGLTTALRAAGGLKPDSYLGEVLITRFRPDSSRVMLSSPVADTTGRVARDIQLVDGDEIQVFSLTQFRPHRYVIISGAVRKPGRTAFRDGMTLRDLVLLSGGVEESALLSHAEIARMPEDRAGGVTARTMIVPLDSSYLFERASVGPYRGPPGIAVTAARAPDVQLQPYDAVLILRQPDWQLQRMVAIEGEVKFPGPYALVNKAERLTDAITRAGGLTDDAYANGIVFVRKRNNLGRIGVDLPSVLRDPGHVDNLILFEGDSIYIPLFTGVVNVRGAVNSPVAVAYVRGADLDYYVRAAGGGDVKSSVGKAYVTQPNGKVESRNRRAGLFVSVPKPQPGSTVFVPEKDPTEKHDYLPMIGALAQVLASVVGIIAIARR